MEMPDDDIPESDEDLLGDDAAVRLQSSMEVDIFQ